MIERDRFLADLAALDQAAREVAQRRTAILEQIRAGSKSAYRQGAALAEAHADIAHNEKMPTTVSRASYTAEQLANILSPDILDAQIVSIIIAAGGRDLFEAADRIPWSSLTPLPSLADGLAAWYQKRLPANVVR